jgi:hypothetical protein
MGQGDEVDGDVAGLAHRAGPARRPGQRSATAVVLGAARYGGRCLTYLGVEVDPDRNEDAGSDADISAAGAVVRTVVVTAREDLEIMRHVVGLTR